MKYCTFIYGKEWHEKFAANIVKECKSHDIYILTNMPEYFKGCEFVEEYTRPVFSYYEKLNWVLKLSKELKQRVTYVDADWVFNLTQGLENIDEEQIYTYRILQMSVLTDRKMLIDLFESADYPWNDDDYIPEGIISMPYLPDILDNVIADIEYLQPFWENTFTQETKVTKILKRYTKFGIGYAEGGALTAVAHKYGIKYSARKKLIRRNDLLI